jgi:hypothetical protein
VILKTKIFSTAFVVRPALSDMKDLNLECVGRVSQLVDAACRMTRGGFFDAIAKVEAGGKGGHMQEAATGKVQFRDEAEQSRRPAWLAGIYQWNGI